LNQKTPQRKLKRGYFKGLSYKTDVVTEKGMEGILSGYERA